MTIDEAMNSAREMLIYRKLEELNKVKQELNKVSQELEVYKKALELACNDVRCANPEAKNCDKCPLSFNSNCFSANTKIDYYLDKAKETNT